MVNLLKKFAIVAIALTLAVTPVAAASSPSKGSSAKPEAHKSIKVGRAKYSTSKNGKATYKARAYKKNAKVTVPSTIKYKKVKYKVTTVAKEAFKGSKAKTVVFYGNPKIKKGAFKKSKVKLVLVRKKYYKTMKSKLKKAGYKKKIETF